MKQLLFLFIALFFWNCEPQSKPESTTPENGVVKSKRMEGGKPARNQEIEYKDGKIVRVTVFYDNGKVESETHLDKIRNITDIQAFYESGKRKLTWIGTSDSLFIVNEWYENGNIRKEVTIFPDKKEISIEYYENGKEKNRVEFFRNNRHGVWKEWDSLGVQTRNEQYVNGTLKK